MKFAKMLIITAFVTAALLAFSGSASATVLTNGTGSTYGVGTIIHAEAATPLTLHPPIGDITCTSSTIESNVTNAGSASTTVSGDIIKLTFGGCNATVTTLGTGTLEVHTKTASADGNGTLTSNGAQVTIVFAGFHCIFSTSHTDIGTVTGSKTGPAEIDIEATIPRTGGSAFCGSTAQWTGAYVVRKPSPLYVD